MAQSLAMQLSDLGYLRLFMSADKKDLELLWTENGPKKFQEVEKNTQNTPYARLLAMEILLFKGHHTTLPNQEIATVYCESLPADFVFLANPWGTPEHPGGLSKRVSGLGQEAGPSCKALLSNTTTLHYVGSRDATTGNILKVRVKDMAARMLCDIYGISYEFQMAPQDRDKWIEKNLAF